VNEVIQAAAELQNICESENWQFCFIGEQLQPLAQLKEAPEILDRLEARRVEFER